MSDGNNLALPDAIGHNGFILELEHADMPEPAVQHMAKLNRAITALGAICEVLEADEYLTDKSDEGIFSYDWIPGSTRWGLRCAQQVILEEVGRRKRLFLKSVGANRQGSPANE